jgi:hypothetical protein
MADATNNPRPLKLVKIFDDSSRPNQQQGYEKVDDDRVLERYSYPLRWRNNDNMKIETAMVVTLFDFKSFTATETREVLDRTGGLMGDILHTSIPFSAFENKQAIADAHRALIELGGNPPPIDALLNEDVAVKKPVTTLKAIQLNKK